MSRFQDTEITWLGHAAFHLKSPEGTDVLIDPWLDNPSAPDINKDEVSADIIALTHGHFDHMGNTVEIAKRTGATVVGIFEIAQYLGNQGLEDDQTVGMNIGGTAEVDGLKFTMVHAIHSSGIVSDANLVQGGDPAGFVIEMENGYGVYHTGDTELYSDMKLIGEFHNPDMMLVCMGDHFTMGPEKAARSIEWVDPEYSVPMHYGTFPLLTGTPEALKSALPEKYKERVVVADPGEKLT